MVESHEQERATGRSVAHNPWVAGGVSGLIAGVVMGLMLQTMMTPVITTAIPALYGGSGVVVGWIAHLFHSVVFGLLFVGAVGSVSSLGEYASRVSTGAGLGLGYGVLLWVVAAGFVMPIWLGAVGFPGTPPTPNFNPMSLVGHVVFGVVLGALYPLLRNR